MGFIVLLVKLYTGIAWDGWVAIFHATAMAKLIGTSTGTKSATNTLLGFVRVRYAC
jgi:hypothetical protein